MINRILQVVSLSERNIRVLVHLDRRGWEILEGDYAQRAWFGEIDFVIWLYQEGELG